MGSNGPRRDDELDWTMIADRTCLNSRDHLLHERPISVRVVEPRIDDQDGVAKRTLRERTRNITNCVTDIRLSGIQTKETLAVVDHRHQGRDEEQQVVELTFIVSQQTVDLLGHVDGWIERVHDEAHVFQHETFAYQRRIAFAYVRIGGGRASFCCCDNPQPHRSPGGVWHARPSVTYRYY